MQNRICVSEYVLWITFLSQNNLDIRFTKSNLSLNVGIEQLESQKKIKLCLVKPSLVLKNQTWGLSYCYSTYNVT